MIELHVCPGTLKEGYSTYSPRCLREVFNGSDISHRLDIDLPDEPGNSFPLRLHRRKFSFAGEGQYILKTMPADMMNADAYVANAHLTMQLASEVFDIPVSPSAIIFLKDETPAIIIKRFDVRKDGSVCAVDDFASLAGLSESTSGSHYRYQLSYYDMSLLIDRFFPASIAAKEQLFRTVVFNYLFSNGNGHLGSFARVDCGHNGDGRLAPASELVNTALHGDSGDLALLGGLYDRDYEKLSFKAYGCYGYDDFFQFGMKMGIVSFRVKRFMDQLLGSRQEVEGMISRSFLSREMKGEYYRLYEDRHAKLSRSYSGLRREEAGSSEQ